MSKTLPLAAALIAASLSCGAWAQSSSSGTPSTSSDTSATGTYNSGSYGTNSSDSMNSGAADATGTSGTSSSAPSYAPADNSAAPYLANGRLSSSAPDRTSGLNRHNAAGGLPAGELSTPMQDGGASAGYNIR